MNKKISINIWALAIPLTLVFAGCQPVNNSTTPTRNNNETTGKQQINPAITIPPATQNVNTETIISKKMVMWNEDTFTINHSCIGSVKYGNLYGDTAKQAPYCLGINKLKLADKNGIQTQLSENNITNAAEAPVLLDAQVVPGSKEGLVLVAYRAESCTTTNDCGAGMPTNYLSMTINLLTKKPQEIQNFPTTGISHWNADGTKAIFIPETCAGRECNVEPLLGYNVSQDQQNPNLTTEKAAGSSSKQGQLEDSEGKKLSTWQSITWTTTSKFRATYINKDGATKIIEGSF